MNADWKRRFTWVDLGDFDEAFETEPFPPRGHRGSLAMLRDSIARFGVIQPIIARVNHGKLQVVCGYRRWLAAQVAGVESVPVIVTRLSDHDAEQLFKEESAGAWSTAWSEAPRTQPQSDAVIESTGPAAETRVDVVAREAERAATPEPAEGGDADAASDLGGALESVFQETCGIFAATRRQRRIDREAVDSVVERLIELQPISSGYDIRELGESTTLASGCDTDAAPLVASHSLRVAMLAEHVARLSAWSNEAVSCLSKAAFLHDVGMLVVSDEWLQSSLLPQRVHDKVRVHTVEGEKLVLSEWPAAIAGAAREHHERWDGTGYPGGRKGKDVGLASRLIGVMDSYAAMVSKRVYRPAYSIREAIRILRESTAVGLFDPELVDRFLGLMTEFPVGLIGKMPDGSIVRVHRIREGDERTHMLRVQDDSAPRRGQVIWASVSELESALTEIPLDSAPRDPVVEALAEIP